MNTNSSDIAETPVAGPLLSSFSKTMMPQSVQKDTPSLVSAIICHIMLLNSVLERRGNRFAGLHGLTFPQWMALGCIGNCGETGITHSELGKRLKLSKAPITGIVDRLERGLFVTRAIDVNDRRISRITITDKGEETWRAVRQSLRQHGVNFCSCLSEDEQQQALSLLSRLLEALSTDDASFGKGSEQE